MQQEVFGAVLIASITAAIVMRTLLDDALSSISIVIIAAGTGAIIWFIIGAAFSYFSPNSSLWVPFSGAAAWLVTTTLLGLGSLRKDRRDRQ